MRIGRVQPDGTSIQFQLQDDVVEYEWRGQVAGDAFTHVSVDERGISFDIHQFQDQAHETNLAFAITKASFERVDRIGGPVGIWSQFEAGVTNVILNELERFTDFFLGGLTGGSP